ncbi:MAG: hypothetical protein HOA66_04210 [Candidatus Marinimicrobia bacterium]|nr:hypothetical protein [Candidatus Neomarinimicrobiota bacterium]
MRLKLLLSFFAALILFSCDAMTSFEPPINPSITVTTPNGGEEWEPGEYNYIYWVSENLSGDYVNIDLYYNGSYYSSIASNTMNDGSHYWSIPSNQSSSDYYKIKICDSDDPNICDESDNYFSIQATTETITVTNPYYNGEDWNDYYNQTIQWTSTGSISNVKISLYYSTSAYGTYYLYNTIASYTSNDGSYSWYPYVPSYSYYYKIRIEDYYDSSVYDDSYYFTVY